MAFFNQFPKRTYDLQRDGKNIAITDTFRNVDVNDKLIDTISAYQYYQIKDGERPDHVATKLYNNAGYYWSFFVVNDHLKKGYGSWPMSYTQFDDYMNENYRAYSIMELRQEDFSKVSAISNFTSLSLGFEFDSPLGANESPNNILGTIHKIDTETNQIWIKNPSERLINSLDGRASHEFKIFDTSDGANFDTAFKPRIGWGYGDNAYAYYRDTNDKRVGIYDATKEIYLSAGMQLANNLAGAYLTYKNPSTPFSASIRSSLPQAANRFDISFDTAAKVSKFKVGNKVIIFGLELNSTDRATAAAAGITIPDLNGVEMTVVGIPTTSGFNSSGYTYGLVLSGFPETTIAATARSRHTAEVLLDSDIGYRFNTRDAYILTMDEYTENTAQSSDLATRLGNPVTYREFEEDENEKLKSIRIVKPDQIGAFADLYKTLINE